LDQILERDRNFWRVASAGMAVAVSPRLQEQMKVRLFFLAAFHAYVVLGLARLSGVVLRTGLLLIAALCAARRLSLHWIIGAP
jgi:hypothetical protein